MKNTGIPHDLASKVVLSPSHDGKSQRGVFQLQAAIVGIARRCDRQLGTLQFTGPGSHSSWRVSAVSGM